MTTVWTVGHSTRSADDFIALLRLHSLQALADIRTVPKSRRNPQFAAETLATTLTSAGIDYIHMPGLGGLRRPRRDSTNTAWKNDSFRGYADYMETVEFQHSLHQLIALATRVPTAIMCAEAVPWRCHRSLVADALTAREIRVLHIIGETAAAKPHSITAFARLEGPTVTYPGLPVPLTE